MRGGGEEDSVRSKEETKKSRSPGQLKTTKKILNLSWSLCFREKAKAGVAETAPVLRARLKKMTGVCLKKEGEEEEKEELGRQKKKTTTE